MLDIVHDVPTIFDCSQRYQRVSKLGRTSIAVTRPRIMAIWGTKQTMHYTRDHRVDDGLEYIANWNAGMFDTDDMAEAFRAKAEQRVAEFPDLLPVRDGI